MPVADFTIKQGDTSSAIYATLENSGGTAVDIQGAAVSFKMAPINGGTVTVSAAASNLQNGDGSDGSRGDVSYTWSSSLGTAGFYLAEWQVTYAGGAVQTFPNDSYVLVNVAADIR